MASSFTEPSQLDIEGLNITVTSGEKTADRKGKGKAKGDGVEILSDAKLRLKAGQRYALIGRNGSGKSSEFPPLSVV
jgi:ABC-type polysaccharide/polyol phosphate transport system ATPase subunit